MQFLDSFIEMYLINLQPLKSQFHDPQIGRKTDPFHQRLHEIRADLIEPKVKSQFG